MVDVRKFIYMQGVRKLSYIGMAKINVFVQHRIPFLQNAKYYIKLTIAIAIAITLFSRIKCSYISPQPFR